MYCSVFVLESRIPFVCAHYGNTTEASFSVTHQVTTRANCVEIAFVLPVAIFFLLRRGEGRSEEVGASVGTVHDTQTERMPRGRSRLRGEGARSARVRSDPRRAAECRGNHSKTRPGKDRSPGKASLDARELRISKCCSLSDLDLKSQIRVKILTSKVPRTFCVACHSCSKQFSLIATLPPV